MKTYLQKAILLAAQHWEYVSALIGEYDGWAREAPKRRLKAKKKHEIAYLSGFIYGYLEGNENESNYYISILDIPVSSKERFHYQTAYSHGQKHRKQDDTETRTQETIL